MSNTYDIQTPYIACYIILRDKNGRIAFLLRNENTDWMQGYYGLVQGKVEKHESFLSAAVREAKEELGINVRKENIKHLLTTHRKSNDSKFDWIDIFFEITEWAGEPYNAEPDKHAELAWFAADALPKNVIPNITESLKRIEQGHVYAELNWEESK